MQFIRFAIVYAKPVAAVTANEYDDSPSHPRKINHKILFYTFDYVAPNNISVHRQQSITYLSSNSVVFSCGIEI